MQPIIWVIITLLAVFGLLPVIVNAFLRNVEAGEIRLVGWMGGRMSIYRGPCKAMMIPLLTGSKVIPAQGINVDIEITDPTPDLEANRPPAPVKATAETPALANCWISASRSTA